MISPEVTALPLDAQETEQLLLHANNETKCAVLAHLKDGQANSVDDIYEELTSTDHEQAHPIEKCNITKLVHSMSDRVVTVEDDQHIFLEPFGVIVRAFAANVWNIGMRHNVPINNLVGFTPRNSREKLTVQNPMTLSLTLRQKMLNEILKDAGGIATADLQQLMLARGAPIKLLKSRIEGLRASGLLAAPPQCLPGVLQIAPTRKAAVDALLYTTEEFAKRNAAAISAGNILVQTEVTADTWRGWMTKRHFVATLGPVTPKQQELTAHLDHILGEVPGQPFSVSQIHKLAVANGYTGTQESIKQGLFRLRECGTNPRLKYLGEGKKTGSQKRWAYATLIEQFPDVIR